MAEEIKVVLEADASQLTGEFRKAQAAAADFSRKTLPLVESSLNSTWVQQQRLARGMEQGRKGVRDYSGGLLQLAQTADDAQYGLRGVLNNIPGLVMGLGAGAGLAGAISLAVLAAAKLGPLLKDLYGDGEIEKINAVAAATARRYDVELQKLREVAREREVQQEVTDLTREMALYAQQNLRVLDQRLTVMQDQRKELEMMRRLEDELSAARGGGPPGSGADLRVRRLQEDLELARREAQLANAEYDRIATEAANVSGPAAANLAAAREEIARLQRSIASGEANVEGNRAGVEAGVEGSRAALAAAERRLAADKERLQVQEAYVRQLEQEASKAAGMAKETLSNLSARIDGGERERRALEKQIPIYERIAEAQRKVLQDQEEARKNAELDDRRRTQWELRTMGGPQDPEEARLNRELEARRASQEQARRREQQRIEDAWILQGVRPSRPREETRRSLQIGRLEGARGLRSAAEQRLARERATPDKSAENAALNYYERSLSDSGRIVKSLEALGSF